MTTLCMTATKEKMFEDVHGAPKRTVQLYQCDGTNKPGGLRIVMKRGGLKTGVIESMEMLTTARC